MKKHIIFFSLLFVFVFGDFISIVSYFKDPTDKVVCSVRFDDNNKLIAIDKLFSNGKEIDRKMYDFNSEKYLVGLLKDFQYKCTWYDSILLDYFSVNDIIKPVVYNTTMSRVLSIFFSGSWIGENLTRTDNIISCEYWKMEILSYSAINDDLSSLQNSCK